LSTSLDFFDENKGVIVCGYARTDNEKESYRIYQTANGGDQLTPLSSEYIRVTGTFLELPILPPNKNAVFDVVIRDILSVTYDDGEHYATVPVDVENLMYESGSTSTLKDSAARAAFSLYCAIPYSSGLNADVTYTVAVLSVCASI